MSEQPDPVAIVAAAGCSCDAGALPSAPAVDVGAVTGGVVGCGKLPPVTELDSDFVTVTTTA